MHPEMQADKREPKRGGQRLFLLELTRGIVYATKVHVLSLGGAMYILFKTLWSPSAVISH